MLPLTDNQLAKAKETFLTDLSACLPELADAGSDLFECISTPNWALEWGLPRWLGRLFDLPADVTWELLLSNIYLLAFGRITDDLADGETRSPGKSAIALSVVLHHLWIRQYVRLFGNQPRDTTSVARAVGKPQAGLNFWAYFDDYMAQGIQATLNRGRRPASTFQSYTESDFQCLAQRGAPLKICCAAACFLGGREDEIRPLASVMDQLLVGIVLLDDRFDWKADLEAGRYNAFVAHCSDLPQTGEWRELNRQAVLKEIYLGDAGRTYFDLIQDRMKQAERSAELSSCADLRDFARWYSREVAECGTWLAVGAKRQLLAAAERFAQQGSLFAKSEEP